ncbi:MAG: hypothetical protein K2Q97_02080, partial [Burkholderiaceae bacterium]|nr:hypothetical protein [Burkholderiaceae bacterium]
RGGCKKGGPFKSRSGHIKQYTVASTSAHAAVVKRFARRRKLNICFALTYWLAMVAINIKVLGMPAGR